MKIRCSVATNLEKAELENFLIRCNKQTEREWKVINEGTKKSQNKQRQKGKKRKKKQARWRRASGKPKSREGEGMTGQKQLAV